MFDVVGFVLSIFFEFFLEFGVIVFGKFVNCMFCFCMFVWCLKRFEGCDVFFEGI